MPSLGIIKANLFAIQFSTDDGATFDGVAQGKSLTISFDTQELNATNFDSEAGWEAFLMANKSWSASFNGHLKFEDVADTLNFDDMYALFAAGTKGKLKYTTAVSGDTFMSGFCFVKGGSLAGSHGELSDVSFELRGTGPLSPAVVPA